ncbi:probable protein phosphatase 2C 51 isoform X2 [Coffea arabica]|nr:probable protein phosphatase 2C 51 isoform X2 [Coffea arabica]XP_027096101.1 probable protein phosphatase 2C 51 isoform X2 [Coffea arabica]
MEVSKIALVRVLAVALSLCAVVRCCSAHHVSVACMMAYDEGGSPALFRSQECPLREWTPSNGVSQNHPTANCGFAAAILQGRRNYQEDRIACNPAMKIPFLGNDGQENVNVGVAAVFDGHGGAEASEFASKKFLSYFYLNVLFNIYKQASPHKGNDEANQNKSSVERSGTTSSLIDDTSLYDILNEALIRTFRDIDSEFTREALRNNYASGSTGTVALIVNGRLLVGFVGDSKALLCSNRSLASQGGEGTSMRTSYVQELTKDHHPDREDEKARIETAGGFVHTWGVPRVNGILAMTRAIGNLSLRRFGVIAEPEVIGWQTLTTDNSFLVIGSDGIFEGLTPANVCAILHNNACKPGTTESSGSSSCLAPSALANRIVNNAYENGSHDNISVIVIPLESAYHSQ